MPRAVNDTKMRLGEVASAATVQRIAMSRMLSRSPAGAQPKCWKLNDIGRNIGAT